MSILAATASELDRQSLSCLAGWAGLSLLLVWGTRAFRRWRIVGPPRLAEEERAWPVFLIFMIGVAAWLAVPMFYGAVRQVMRVASGQEPFRSNDQFPPLELIAVGVAGSVVAFVVLILANRITRPEGLTRLGLAPRQSLAGVLGGTLCIFIILPWVILAGVGGELFWQWLGFEHPTEHELLRMLEGQRQGLGFYLIVFAAIGIAPVFEELLFRGHLQTVLVRALEAMSMPRPVLPPPLPVTTEPPRVDLSNGPIQLEPASPARRPVWQRWAAVIVTSLVFTMIHEWWSWPPIFVLALCMGYAYERTGNLYVPIIAHLIFNSFGVLQYLYSMG